MTTFVTLYLIGAIIWLVFDFMTSYRYVNQHSRPYFIGYLVTNFVLWWIAFPLSFFEDPARFDPESL